MTKDIIVQTVGKEEMKIVKMTKAMALSVKKSDGIRLKSFLVFGSKARQG